MPSLKVVLKEGEVPTDLADYYEEFVGNSNHRLFRRGRERFKIADFCKRQGYLMVGD